jgi:hypothetical protein
MFFIIHQVAQGKRYRWRTQQTPPEFTHESDCLPDGYARPVPPNAGIAAILEVPLLALRKPSRPYRASQSSPA